MFKLTPKEMAKPKFRTADEKKTTAGKRPKPVYTITAFDDTTPTAVYSCLKTLCQQWGCFDHYHTIWRWLKHNDEPYTEANFAIKRHILIKSDNGYKKTRNMAGR